MSLITVTVPVYRVAPYLSRCIGSILAQTFASCEVILVDDGSPDKCGAICDEYAIADNRVLVIHQPNGGLSAARNVGIDWAVACSDSQWLAFVDSDDWVHPRYLEYLHRAYGEFHTEVVACDYIEVSSYEEPHEMTYDSRYISWDNFFIENGSRAVIAWNKLYAKELFDGLRYPVGRIQEDEFLTYKLLHRAGDVAFVSCPLYSYFWNPEGITNSRFNLGWLDGIDAHVEFIAYAHAKGLRHMMTWGLRRYYFACIEVARQLYGAEWIPSEVRNSEYIRIKRQARMILIRYGLLHLSPRADYECYSFPFPHLMKAVRTSLYELNRLKEVFTLDG